MYDFFPYGFYLLLHFVLSRYVLSIYAIYSSRTFRIFFFPSQRASEEDIGRTCTQQRSSSGGDPLEIQPVPKILFHEKLRHSSEIRGVCLMLQTLSYFWNKKTQVDSAFFSFHATLLFPLMNAKVYCNLDQGIY